MEVPVESHGHEVLVLVKGHQREIVFHHQVLNHGVYVWDGECSLHHHKIMDVTLPWITQSCLVQLQVPRHGLVLVKAGVHQFLYLRKLMRAGNLVCHLRSLLTHDVLLLVTVTQCILDMTEPIPLTPVYY